MKSVPSAYRGAGAAILAALFGLFLAEPAAAQRGARPAKDDSLTFEMRSMPWASLFEWLSDKTGMPVISTIKPPRGSLNIISPKKKYTLAQVMDIINESLLEEKLVLIRGNKSFTLVPAGKIRPGLVPRVSVPDLDQRGKSEIVSVVLRLRTIAADKELVDEIKQLQGPFGEIKALTKANQLIVQDTVGNIDNILTTVKDIQENQKGVAEGSFEVIKLKKANATNVARVLDEIYNGKPTQGPASPFPFGGRGRFGGFGMQPPANGNGKNNEPRIRVVADPDSNQIMVKATPLDMAAIKKLVKESLDVGDTDSEASLRTYVIGPLKHAHADDVAAVIKDVYRENMNNNPTADQQRFRRGIFFGGNNPSLGIDANGKPKGVSLSISVDDRTNSLIVQCPANLHKDIEKLVGMLEKAASKITQTVKVVRVDGIDPKIIQQALDAIQGRVPITSLLGNGGLGGRGNMLAQPGPFGGRGQPGPGGPGGRGPQRGGR